MTFSLCSTGLSVKYMTPFEGPNKHPLKGQTNKGSRGLEIDFDIICNDPFISMVHSFYVFRFDGHSHMHM